MSESDKQSTATNEAWEAVLGTLCRLQTVLPDAVLVDGTASALYAGHRFSFDHHVLPDLRERRERPVMCHHPKKWQGWTHEAPASDA
jgi:hypothetical protein